MKTELMAVVEQVVRPLPALKANKLRMRMELYSLLEQIYQEELSHQDTTEAAALQQASRRFGDPRQLREELLQTIPIIERAWATADRLLVRRREGESLVHFSARIGLHAGIGMLLFGMLIFFTATYELKDPPEPSFWIWWTFAVLTVGIDGFVLTLLGNRALAQFRWEQDRVFITHPFRFVLYAASAGLLVAISEVVHMFFLVGVYWKLGYSQPFFIVWGITGMMFAGIVWLRAREDVHFRRWRQVSFNQPSLKRAET